MKRGDVGPGLRTDENTKYKLTLRLKCKLRITQLAKGRPLTFNQNVVAKNHPFPVFLSATKSQFLFRKDNDLIPIA